jgi:hypothetical protein
MNHNQPRSFAIVVAVIALIASSIAYAQYVAPGKSPEKAAPASPAETPLTPLGWLDGCWRGSVNQREFREHWLPLRGGVMLGVSHTVMLDKTQDYEYLRLEMRPDGVYYVIESSDAKPAQFKLAETTTDGDATIFTFTNVADDFPQRIIYRRGSLGWLYATVEGKQDGKDRQIIYPMRRISCETGDQIHK